ncbi:glycoside hydrolase superfamily [Dactylonectria estremocensis]|uniref:beta-glucosidase n=1 Tax=Dactylonectria estremocensis TaxID=1079267 RepID=A0A9P9IGZ2_9HYPO|nr:glycoside hydrolase superfamily [Dactylonectria estremocensis]
MSEERNMWAQAEQATFSQLTGPGFSVENLKLPPDFVWGAATAAYQVEGGATQDGKGKSIWDVYSHLDPSRTNGENADVTCDHYNRVDEDVKLMKSLGMDTYRFSIAWSRIIPLGGRHDPVNEAGISFYNRLIDTLLAHDITPSVTLYHWDVPQALYDRYKAFLNTTEFRADYQRYARLCFTRFGDRVKSWVTFNEPYIISIFGHLNGSLAPGHCLEASTDTKTEPWRVGHTIILSHASVVQMYANEFQPSQNGKISIVLNGHFYEPHDATKQADIDAAQIRLEFYIGWFGDPIFLGKDYPAPMKEYLGTRLPSFTTEDLELLKATYSINAFYGMNHYSTKFVRQLTTPAADDDWTRNIEELSVNSKGEEIGPASSMPWLRIAPGGFRKVLNWVWDRYRLPILVTENGCPCPGEADVKVAIDDQFRQRYIGLYLDSISRAIYEDGVKVEGYYVWSLMDNFEWSSGYGPRYGIVHVDFDTLKRTPKNSAYYLQETFQKRRKGRA